MPGRGDIKPRAISVISAPVTIQYLYSCQLFTEETDEPKGIRF